MPYIGVSPQFGVRRKHTYTATAGQTSFSGAGSEGATLSYKDSTFVDVYQNGIKLGDADYTSTSGTAIVLTQGASVDDLVEIVVFDVFSVADTVSKADGGTFDGAVSFAGNITDTGDLTIDVEGDLTLDANGADIKLSDNGTVFGELTNSSSYLRIKNPIQDQDIEFVGNDGGSDVTALRLDMSADGHAYFKNGATLSDGNLVVASGHGIDFSATAHASGMDSEVFSDYEEGTFTATAANSVTFHTGTAQQQLAYTKIGRQVHVAGSLQINNSNGGSALTVNNLPFTSMNNANIYYSSTTIRFYQYNVPIEADGGDSDTINFVGVVHPNSTTVHFMQSRDSDTTIVLPASSGAYIIFGITYFAA